LSNSDFFGLAVLGAGEGFGTGAGGACTGSTTSFLTSNILAKGRIFKPPSVGFGAGGIADDFFGDSFSLVAALESKSFWWYQY